MFSCFFSLKNVFPTVKILTFSRGEFKYVQMDQGLWPWFKYRFSVVMSANLEFYLFMTQNELIIEQ
jgi:hypothetical protein